MKGSMTQVLIPVDKGKPSVQQDLDQEELAALGMAVSQWAFLETQVLFATQNLHEISNTTVPPDATQDSFRKRLKAFRAAIELFRGAPIHGIYLPLLDKIAKLNGDRQAMTHGVWAFDERNGDRIGVYVVRGDDSGKPRQFTPHDLASFSEQVGEIIFTLMYPEGLEEYYEELGARLEEQGALIARELYRPKKSGDA